MNTFVFGATVTFVLPNDTTVPDFRGESLITATSISQWLDVRSQLSKPNESVLFYNVSYIAPGKKEEKH